MGIDDESSHPELCSEVANGVTRNIVSFFREPDAGNLPVRFDELEQETEPSQTGLRVTRRKPRQITTGRLKLLRLFSTLLAITPTTEMWRNRCLRQRPKLRFIGLSLFYLPHQLSMPGDTPLADARFGNSRSTLSSHASSVSISPMVRLSIQTAS
jgi:hypothetical protein